MKTVIFDISRYDVSIRNWWVSLVLGILFLVIGILVFFRPAESYFAFATIFGVMVVLSGILEIYLGAITPLSKGRGWLIAAGVIELLLGILLFVMPQILVTIIPFILGFWLMFRGFTTIGAACDMMGSGIKGTGWVIALAILVILCSFVVLAYPVIGVGAIVIWMGCSLVLAGIALIVYAFQLNKLRKLLQD